MMVSGRLRYLHCWMRGKVFDGARASYVSFPRDVRMSDDADNFAAVNHGPSVRAWELFGHRLPRFYGRISRIITIDAASRQGAGCLFMPCGLPVYSGEGA